MCGRDGESTGWQDERIKIVNAPESELNCIWLGHDQEAAFLCKYTGIKILDLLLLTYLAH